MIRLPHANLSAHDPDGNDREFVQYLVDDPVQRNDYSR